MRSLVALLLLLPLLASAEPEGVEAEQNNETIQPEVEQPDTEKQPSPEQLRARKIGAAFKNFKPSEEISADNAVSFPVDI